MSGPRVEPKPVYAVMKVVTPEKDVKYKVVETTDQCKKSSEKDGTTEYVQKMFPKTDEGKAQAEKFLAKIQKMRDEMSKADAQGSAAPAESNAK